MQPPFGRVLVTGGRGFLGRHLVAALRRAGHGAATIGPPRPGDATDHIATAGPADRHGIARALATLRPSLVLHCAAAPPPAAPALHEAVTLAGTAALLAALGASRPVPALLAIGSAAEFGPALPPRGEVPEEHPCRPVTAYGRAKHAASLAVLRHAEAGIGHAAVLRLFTLAGPGAPAHSLVGRLSAEIAALPPTGGTVRVAGPGRERDYLEVSEAARLILALATRLDALPPVVNLCSGQAIAVRDWVAGLAGARGIPVRLETAAATPRVAEAPRVVGAPTTLRRLGLLPAPLCLPELAAGIMSPWAA